MVVKHACFSRAVNNTWSAAPSYEYILVDTRGDKKNDGVITLNRPKARNALCDPLMRELSSALDAFEVDPAIGAVVITGDDKAFAGLWFFFV